MSADDLLGRWVPTPDGGVGQVWAVAGCRHSSPGFGLACAHKGCPPSVWVADGHAWHLIAVADIQRAQIGATA